MPLTAVKFTRFGSVFIPTRAYAPPGLVCGDHGVYLSELFASLFYKLFGRAGSIILVAI